jgi:hypothetical protein
MKRLIYLIASSCLLVCCSIFSESVKRGEIGFNGSFEIIENGLPVNWYVYTPNTVRDGQFTFALDSVNASHGKRAAHFSIQSCNAEGGRFSPGLTNEVRVEGNSRYKITFDLKNQGSHCQFKAGPVSAKAGQAMVMLEVKQKIDKWDNFYYEVFIPADDSLLLLQWNWLKPGEGWLDHVVIEKMEQ